MKAMFEYIRCFQFKNFLAVPLIAGLFWMMGNFPALHDSCIMLLTLLIKYYYDSNTQSAKKDATIESALTAAQNTPATPVTVIEQPVNTTEK